MKVIINKKMSLIKISDITNLMASTYINRPTIQHFNPQAYMGNWWEIGRYDNLFFEKGCSRASAQYTLNSDGSFNILNTCYQGNKTIRSDTGRGRMASMAEPGKLLVSFDRPSGLPENVPWQPFEGPYWIHYTDYENYAIVGGPTNDFLWILSRQPVIRPEEFAFLLDLVVKLGYSIKPLIFDPVAISNEGSVAKPSTPVSPWVKL